MDSRTSGQATHEQVGLTGLRRISVAGASGAGKSSLSTWMGQKLCLPVVHMDKEFFHPGWQRPVLEDWRDRVERLVSAPSWVMEGNYFDVMEPRLRRTQAFVFLDTARAIRLPRVLWRTLANLGRARADTGQLERLSWSHFRNAYYYMERRRQTFAQLEATCQKMDIPWIRLATATEIREFKSGLLLGEARAE